MRIKYLYKKKMKFFRKKMTETIADSKIVLTFAAVIETIA